MPHALGVAHEVGNLSDLQNMFMSQGYSFSISRSLAQAREEISRRLPDLAMIRPTLPDGNGLVLLQDSRFAQAAEVLLLSENIHSEEGIVTALRIGSRETEARPYSSEELSALLIEVARDLAVDVSMDLGQIAGQETAFGRMIGRSSSMGKLYRLIRKVAPTSATALLIGDSGTGKELLAESIHNLSDRVGKAFVAVNCGAIQHDLMESELFGHEKGSFTSASRQHRGIFERADGGTLFLDEVTEMPVELQVKLLRVLEYGRFTRVGGEQDIEVCIRIVAATNRDPMTAVKEGRLREDLYYRLAQFPIRIPPLREREGDVELLAQYFIETANAQQAGYKVLSESALKRLREYHWPGNVRELKNVIERAYIVADDVIQASDLLLLGEGIESDTGSGYVRVKVGQPIGEAEKALILATLEKNNGEKQKTADELGISLKTLYNRLNDYEQLQR